MANLLKKSKIGSKLCPIIYHYSDIGSTNNVVKFLILEKNKMGFAVVADVQTSGYGQKDRYWESPKGGLWCSLAIKPEVPPKKLGLIPILTAQSVAKALEGYEIRTRLKWPNDILFRKKKLGGILVEGIVSGTKITEYLVIGIGLNINNTLDQYSASLQGKITSTLIILGLEIDLEELLLAILTELDLGFRKINTLRQDEILSEWKKRDILIGKQISILSNDVMHRGLVKDITIHGQLVLEKTDGMLIKLSSGNVSIINN
jgi:BirA family biotin operon repressor/biotin-[acetyl-CoA-carboxylase] ligase